MSAAFPLWSDAGFDAGAGGFHERLDVRARPTTHVRRAFVQARQIYVFCEAGRLGWSGPWKDLVCEATANLLRRYRREDGAFVHAIGSDGSVADASIDLYDQAFVCFGLAHAYDRCDRPTAWRRAAIDNLDYLRRNRGRKGGGFVELPHSRVALRQNPHMHLLEAALAWAATDEEGPWRSLAAELVALASTHMIDRNAGCLFEDFTGDWQPVGGREAASVEPGHQFEWAWLLQTHAEMCGRRTDELVWPLVAFGELHGRDPRRGVVIDQVDILGRPRNSLARIWAQTERLRCCVALLRRAPAEARPGLLAGATEAAASLPLFFETTVEGLWRDRWQTDGFVTDSVPASSLYHIVTAYSCLIRATEHGALTQS